jgi:hypothetical protein
MNGFIVEYVTNGWADIEIQLGVTEPVFDKNKEILGIWEYQSAAERDTILDELTAFRLQQLKEKK